jgi:hypothetical protein
MDQQSGIGVRHGRIVLQPSLSGLNLRRYASRHSTTPARQMRARRGPRPGYIQSRLAALLRTDSGNQTVNGRASKTKIPRG